MSIWVLTNEKNEYNQYGEYFVDAWNTKPSHQQLSAAGVPQNGIAQLHCMGCVFLGGGFVKEWFFLREHGVGRETLDQHPWVGLDEEEIDLMWGELKDALSLDYKTWSRAVEAKLKCKNLKGKD